MGKASKLQAWSCTHKPQSPLNTGTLFLVQPICLPPSMLSQGSCQALRQIDPWWAPPRESAHHSQMCQNPEVISGLGRHSCSPVLYIQEPVGNVVRIRKNSHDLVSRAIFCSCSPRHFWLNAATHSTHTRSGSHLEFKSTHRLQQSKPGGSLSGYTKDINLHIF